jgi:CRISPR-associated endonuclease Csy4
MKSYLEITLLPNPEVGVNFLWSKVFQQIHLGLVEIQDDQGQVPIGLSFPEYVIGDKYSILGSKLRLFANDEAVLKQFDAVKWLTRLSDYVHSTSIQPVPEKIIGYAIYRREQPKTNPERLARRYARRLAEREKRAEVKADYENALTIYSKRNYQSINSPFIRLKSLSSDNNFCLWIKKIPVDIQASTANFSSYGLSSVSSVPEF